MGVCISKEHTVVEPITPIIDPIDEVITYRNEPSPIRYGVNGLKKLREN